MADAVALASVITSGAVALGGIAVAAWQGVAQRKHERKLAYEERVWEAKSTALYDCIGRARLLVDDLRVVAGGSEHVPDPSDRRALSAGRMLAGLDEHGAVLEVYASGRCVDASRNLQRYLMAHGASASAYYDVMSVRERKEAAIDAVDFDDAAKYRHEEVKRIDAANAALTANHIELLVLANAFVDAARESIRGGGTERVRDLL